MITLTHLLYLTGYRASGKTSVAEALGAQLDADVVDLDAEIVAAAGKSIAEIFSEGGEICFRDWESSLLSRVAAGKPAIISLGGGAILRPENRDLIQASGQCVWLDATVEDVVQRLLGDQATESQRPGLTGLPMAAEVRQLMENRRPIYADVSDHCVDTTGKSIDQVADEIVAWMAKNGSQA